MARLFNIEVFNQTINGDATTPPTYYTSSDFSATLGSADSLLTQVIVEGLTDATGAVTVQYQISNTMNVEDFTASAQSITVAPGGTTGASVPKSGFLAITATADLGAYGRFKITYGKGSLATVRIVVCGRSNS